MFQKALWLSTREINEGMLLNDRAMESNPENFNFIHNKGWGLYKQGKYKEALEFLQKSRSKKKTIMKIIPVTTAADLKKFIRLPRLRKYRLFALGVLPEYQGKGIDSLIYRALYEAMYTPDIWLEINYVLEDNVLMNNAIIKLDAKPLRRYRIYQKSI